MMAAGRALNQVHFAQANVSKPVFSVSAPVEAMRFAAAFAPAADVFEKADAPKPVTLNTSAAGKLKAALEGLNFLERKSALAYLLKKTSDIQPPVLAATLGTDKVAVTLKADLDAVADNLKKLSALEKVDLVKTMTGDQSVYAKYVEKVLLDGVKPGLKETLALFKPQPAEDKSLGGFRAVFSAMGMGLSLMPVVLPGAFLFNPATFGQYVAAIGVALV